MGTSRCCRHRSHLSIIQMTIRLTYRSTPSYWEVEELLAERGTDISFEAVRQGCLKFRQIYAHRTGRMRERGSSS